MFAFFLYNVWLTKMVMTELHKLDYFKKEECLFIFNQMQI